VAHRVTTGVYCGDNCPPVSVNRIPRVRLAKNLRDVLVVRVLRNSCREYMTNHRKRIGLAQQIRWHFSYYRRALREGVYRVYLFQNDSGTPVGYGAALLRDGALYVTECVAPNFRGQGYGRAILDELIAIGSHERRTLIAEIWRSNKASIALHANSGFALETTRQQSGADLYVYRLEPRAKNI